jgi:outer membrane receptor protein involved in Fe transport
VNEAGITEMTPGNIGKVREYGISFSMAYQIFEPWRLNLWAQGYNRIIENKNSEYGIYYGEKASYDFNISNIITLSKEFTLNTGIRYGSPKLTYQTQNYRDLLAFVGFEKKLSENSTLSAFYIPPMGEFTYAKRIRKNSQLHNTWAGKIEANHAFSISYTYRFNKGRKVKKIDRNVQYDKDGFKEGM